MSEPPVDDGLTTRQRPPTLVPLHVQREAVGWALAGVAIVSLSIAVVAFRPPLVGPTNGASVVRTAASAAPPTFRDGATNLLKDGSFETESEAHGVAASWVKTDQVAEYAIDDRSNYGSHSQRITKTGTADPVSEYSSVIQTVNGVIGGHTYVVSVDYEYARQGPETPQSVGIVIFSLDKSGKFIDDGTIIDWGWKETAEWTRKGVTFRTSPQAVTVNVQFRMSVNGTLWLDGAALEDVTK